MKIKVLLLSNNRSDLLAKTLASITPALNGFDYDLVVVNHSGDILQGRKQLCSYLSDEDYVLSLEDDWLCNEENTNWVSKSIGVLEKYSDIGIIRLRRSNDGQKPEIITSERDGCKLISCWRSGWTSNPHICKRSVYDKLLPVPKKVSNKNGFEQEFAKRYNASGFATAKLSGYRDEGVFIHIGGGRGMNV